MKRGPEWPEFPNLRMAVDWFKGFLTPEDWEQRRTAAFFLLHQRTLGMTDPNVRGRYFDDGDTFGWYLFLAEAFLDHIWNYEPMFGSRVVPVFAAIGRNLPLIRNIKNVDERVHRMVGADRRQPNGCVFELLVAAAYRRHGASVEFRPEQRGIARSWDLDIVLGDKKYAVECKRMETSEYGDRERSRMRELWRDCSRLLAAESVSAFCNVDVRVPATEVPDGYFVEKVRKWRADGRPSLLWSDELSEGVIGELDMDPLQDVLQHNEVLAAGTRLHELLAGKYVRHANYNQVIRYKWEMSPRYISHCDLAILFRWKNSSDASVNSKARDVFRKLVEAHDQLPSDIDSIVHVGFEAIEGDDIERARYEKILASAQRFDAGNKPLRYAYCHYFMPENPPDQAWAFDETVQWVPIAGGQRRPLTHPLLVLEEDSNMDPVPPWER
ncbi:hypothetical protein FJ938_14510 [Mesorhizobium sp. B2-4-14]|nr:hypothetical protein FJ938_14510 [Mesorhizobium sp. B2-4-14]